MAEMRELMRLQDGGRFCLDLNFVVNLVIYLGVDWEGGGTEQGRFPDKRLPEHTLTCSTR
jgi:hypothetical protein